MAATHLIFRRVPAMSAKRAAAFEAAHPERASRIKLMIEWCNAEVELLELVRSGAARGLYPASVAEHAVNLLVAHTDELVQED